MRDLVVVGGGPVGLGTALHAARAGLDVEVWEPRTGPVDKACGEGLMPGAVRALAALGVEPDGHELTGIRYLDARCSVDTAFRHGPGRGVRRTVLSAALLDAVERAGVPVVERGLRTLDQHEDGVVADGVATRWLVGADGLHSRVRRLAGLDAAPARYRRFGLRAHVAVAPWTSYVEVHWAARSEAYVTPVAPDLVGVAVLSADPGDHAGLLHQHPALLERLAGHGSGPVRGAGPLRQRSRRRTRGRVLLVGDAAGYVDALTGEGIALGLARAEALVAALVADDPDRYETAWRRLGRRHEVLTSGLLAAGRIPPVRHRLVPAAARLPAVFGLAVDQLARPAGAPSPGVAR